MGRCICRRWVCWVILSALLASAGITYGREEVKITPDVVYGHKHGMALTKSTTSPPSCTPQATTRRP